MGKETTCTMTHRGASHAGRLYLETGYLLFRGDIRLKMATSEVESVVASDGILRLRIDSDEAAFTLGADAAKWADKILHPPTRLTKLGIKSGMKVTLIGKMDQDFVTELEAAGAKVSRTNADAVFLAAQSLADLANVASIHCKSLWIIYPKGVKTITESHVRDAGRGVGLMDTKVAAFSPTHTALRFSRPQ